MSATITAVSRELVRTATEPMPLDPDLRAALPELRRALEEQQRAQRARLATADGTAYTTSYLPGQQTAVAARLDGVRRLLAETEAAMARIDDGSFGRCLGCSQPISFVRLEILPHTRYCMSCQQRQDSLRR